MFSYRARVGKEGLGCGMPGLGPVGVDALLEWVSVVLLGDLQ